MLPITGPGVSSEPAPGHRNTEVVTSWELPRKIGLIFTVTRLRPGPGSFPRTGSCETIMKSGKTS